MKLIQFRKSKKFHLKEYVLYIDATTSYLSKIESAHYFEIGDFWGYELASKEIVTEKYISRIHTNYRSLIKDLTCTVK